MQIPKFLTSSADPTKVSTFVRGFLISLIPLAMVVTGIPQAELTGIVDAVVDVIFFALALVGAVQALYGLARKLYLGRWSAD